jgi:hypothetical protein
MLHRRHFTAKEYNHPMRSSQARLALVVSLVAINLGSTGCNGGGSGGSTVSLNPTPALKSTPSITQSNPYPPPNIHPPHFSIHKQ